MMVGNGVWWWGMLMLMVMVCVCECVCGRVCVWEMLMLTVRTRMQDVQLLEEENSDSNGEKGSWGDVTRKTMVVMSHLRKREVISLLRRH